MTDNDYSDWLMIAATAGIDWDNPPPREFLTEEMLIAALQDAPEQLANIPAELRSAEVCFAAVYTDDDALEAVPENLREEVKARKDAITSEEWLAELSCYTGNHYLKLPRKLLTPDFCRQMVERNGCTIDLVPEDLITPELRAIAENRDNQANWERNNRNRTAPIVKSGTQIVMERGLHDRALTLTDEEKKMLKRADKTREKRREKARKFFIEHMPFPLNAPAEDWEDKDFCLTAITLAKGNSAFRCVPFKFWKDRDFCLEAIKRNSLAIEWIRDETLTAEMCFIAVKDNPHALADIPKELQSEELILEAVTRYEVALAYVNKFCLTRRIIETAVRHHRDALQYVPDEWREEARAAIGR